jgi:NAD(P)-dependent dehydrogenase (short-subunit alcohol dehydrogenase family)
VDLSAEGLRVLVTGGGAGIGQAIARAFAQQGASVHICDADARTRPHTVCDISSLADVDRLFDEAQRDLGGLDVLVNNAGIAGPTAKAEEIRPEDWDRCIAVDLSGMFYCARKALPMIKAAGGGSILNISSAAGRLGFAQRTPYAAAKWGVIGLTKSLAIEAGPDNVRVNAILPGIVEGERQETVIAAKAEAYGLGHDEFRDRLLQSTSLHSTVSAEDVANMALFLCTAPGERITGQAISVDADVRYLL